MPRLHRLEHRRGGSEGLTLLVHRSGVLEIGAGVLDQRRDAGSAAGLSVGHEPNRLFPRTMSASSVRRSALIEQATRPRYEKNIIIEGSRIWYIKKIEKHEIMLQHERYKVTHLKRIYKSPPYTCFADDEFNKVPIPRQALQDFYFIPFGIDLYADRRAEVDRV
jgi:hypothetical protein